MHKDYKKVTIKEGSEEHKVLEEQLIHQVRNHLNRILKNADIVLDEDGPMMELTLQTHKDTITVVKLIRENMKHTIGELNPEATQVMENQGANLESLNRE